MMKNLKLGHNDACPCGSGRKYKHCCMSKGNDETYKASLESIGNDLREAMEAQEFNSLEEAQAFAEEFIQRKNRRPLKDFKGLSPEQIMRIIYLPFHSPTFVSFPEVLETRPVAPIVTLFERLIDGIGEKGIKATAKCGNLPRNFCREVAEDFWANEKDQLIYDFTRIQKETDFIDMNITRLVATQAGLVRKYKGRFILSRDCRRMMNNHGLNAIYPRLFKTYIQKFNWVYRHGWDEAEFIQRTSFFTLYLLSRYGDEWRHSSFYEDAFFKAFPSYLKDFYPLCYSYTTPESSARRLYTRCALEHFASFLGLAEVEKFSLDILNSDYCIKSAPLLGQSVKFTLDKHYVTVIPAQPGIH